MLVKDIMTSPVITVSEKDSVIDVAQLLSKNRIHGLPVLEGMNPVGIITETDFFTKGAVNVYLPAYIELIKNGLLSKKNNSVGKEKMQNLLSAKAQDIMSSPCISINQNADIDDFMSIVRDKNLSSVPVVDDRGQLAGIITLFDVINLVKIMQ